VERASSRFSQAKGNVWKGVARYNAKSKGKQLKYIRKVKLALGNSIKNKKG
jgi:hypothetical protein